MATNPRPYLIAIAVVDLVALGIVLSYQLNGQPQLGPLSGMLTALFAAFLAALIALSTVDYLNERSQIRAWVREETLNALGPIYEEVVGNTGSFRDFRSGSTFAWEQLQNQSRGIHVPDTIGPGLRSYYERVASHQKTHSTVWNLVNQRVHETYKTEFSAKIPDARYTDLANLVMECWPQVVDGNLEQLVPPFNMDRYKVTYEQVARGAPVRPAEEVLRKLKEAISEDLAVKVLRKESRDRLSESETYVKLLRAVLLRPWEFST